MSSMNQDIYTLLKEDHKKLQNLFNEILDNCQISTQTFSEAKNMLQAHSKSEEKHFYSAIKQGDAMTFLVNEGVEAHRQAANLANEIANSRESSETWLPKVKVLSDMVNHHIEEEENMVFEGAKNIIDDQQAMDIAKRFEEDKSHLMQTAMSATM